MIFNEQIKAFQAENLMLPGSWPDEMRARGFEVLDILYPDIGSLSRWARENGHTDLALHPDPVQILMEMVRNYKPDVIFIYAGAFFHINRPIRDLLRSAGSKDMVFSGFWGDELNAQLYEYSTYFGDLDFVFTSSDVYQKKFEMIGIPSRDIGNAFDTSIKYTPAPKQDIDVLFCGTTGFGIPEHFNRYQILKDVIPKINIKIYGDDRIEKLWRRAAIRMLKIGMWLPQKFWRIASRVLRSRVGHFLFRRGSQMADYYINAKISGIGPWVKLDQNMHPTVGIYDFLKPLRDLYPKKFSNSLLNGSEYMRLLSRAKIVLNIHRDEMADVGNIRCYEAAGIGVCLLTDRGKQFEPRFKPGVEIATFEGAEELVEKVKYLLSHDAERERIAAAGQRRCLADHTVGHRCDIIAKELQKLAHLVQGRSIGPPKSPLRKQILLARYDTEGQPISYDIAFFLQAAQIKRRQLGCDRLVVAMVPPKNIHNQPGVSDNVNQIVDGYARRFRMAHILVQMSDLMPGTDVLHMKDREIDPFAIGMDDAQIIHFPEEGIPHHSEYYKLVNEHPSMVPGFEASKEAHRYIRNWLDPIADGRRVIALTLRQYKVNPERNNNMKAWSRFLDQLDPKEYAVVVVPDTDAVKEYRESELQNYPIFEPACFDVDLRFALYEQAFLNMFVNNGPCIAATLSKSINYLMFKLVVPNTPTTDPEFIKLLGFRPNSTPTYATATQKWVWENDTYNVILREFNQMVDVIEGGKNKKETL